MGDAVGILPLVTILGAGGAGGEQQGQADQGGQRVAGHGGILRKAVSAAIAASPAPSASRSALNSDSPNPLRRAAWADTLAAMEHQSPQTPRGRAHYPAPNLFTTRRPFGRCLVILPALQGHTGNTRDREKG